MGYLRQATMAVYMCVTMAWEVFNRPYNALTLHGPHKCLSKCGHLLRSF